MVPNTMRAAVLMEPGRFEVKQVPTPQCGPNDVLIAVKRVGICGTDLHIFKGMYVPESLPFIPGHEFSGTVAAIGENVTKFAVGTRVTSEVTIGCGICFYCRKNEVLQCTEVTQVGIHRDGAFAEYVCVPEKLVIATPPDMPFDISALIEPLSCCIRAFDRNAIGLGQSVVVLGAGPIGNLHVQLARLSGAAPIIVADLNAKRLELAEASGADVTVVDPSQLDAIVRKHTDNRGADIVIESVGNARLYEQALQLVRPGGRVVAFGVAGGDAVASFSPFEIVLKELGLKGTVASSGDDFHTALTLLQHGRIRTELFTDAVRPLSDIQSAVEEFIDAPKMLKIQIEI